MCRNRTLLPQPEAPMMTMVSPALTTKSTPFNTGLASNDLWSSEISIIWP